MSRWPTTPIRRVARLGSGHTPSRQHPEYWENCSIPWLTLADVSQLRDGSVSVVTETSETISELGLANSAAELHPAGTVVLSRTASVGFSCILGRDMATSQDFATWTCGERILPRFLLYAVRAQPHEIESRKTGSTHKTIYMPDIETLTTPLPDLATQRAIADYLDTETARIDALIEKKRRMVELLEERRRSAIDVVVVPSALGGAADSGRSSWTVLSLKRVARFFSDGDWIESPYITEDGVRLIQTGNVGEGKYREQGYRYISEATFESLRCTEVRPGDVLISRLAGPVGCACIAPELGVRMVAAVDVAILRPHAHVADPKFVVAYLSSTYHLSLAELLARGSTMQRLSRSQVGDMPLPLPSMEVQRDAVTKIERATASIDAAREALQRQMTLLSEHRQALITAAVTGELELPGAAA